jgi:CheY-like chemotaxis protein
MAVDFASTGHLTISSLHTTNATTALFRLERLGITRGIMVEALLCIIAQRLIKKLCTHCRAISPISDKERKMLEPFALDLPLEAANPIGCPRCNGTGYRGREGVYESITLSRDLIDMIRSGSDINQIREYYRDSGGYLISDHALSKMRDFTFSIKDAYEKVLVEEIFSAKISAPRTVTSAPPSISTTPSLNPSILIVDDDPEIHRLLNTILSNRDYRVTSAQDGIDALMTLSTQQFDLILSDVNMPNLDGFKLIEIMKQKNINTPLVFLTSRTDPEDEIKGLELGASDYLKKPIQKDILLMRISKFLPKQ